jgi:hypothetical protein
VARSGGDIGKSLKRSADHVLHALRGLAVLLGDVIVDFANVAAGAIGEDNFHSRLRFQNVSMSASDTTRPASA